MKTFLLASVYCLGNYRNNTKRHATELKTSYTVKFKGISL